MNPCHSMLVTTNGKSNYNIQKHKITFFLFFFSSKDNLDCWLLLQENADLSKGERQWHRQSYISIPCFS